MKEEKGPLEGLLKKVIKKIGGPKHLTEEDMCRAWEESVGAAAARHSRPTSFKKSSLIVNVDGSSWLYELTTKKREILAKVQTSFEGKKIKDIRFRVGEVKKS